jgi:hypothetical protein
MKGKILVSGVFALAGLSAGCAGVATYQEVPGGLYADYKIARDAEGSLGSKEGRSCAQSILGWIATGDASIPAAANNGGITKVSTVDRHVKNILNIYAEYCTVVHGD